MSFKIPILVVLAFVFLVFSLLDVGFPIKTKEVFISYVVDRSLSSLFVKDEDILKWIKEDIQLKKPKKFNIISFGCDYNVSEDFALSSQSLYIPKITNSYCTDLDSVLRSDSIYRNVVVISDFYFSSSFKKKDDMVIEFVDLRSANADLLKIVSWELPLFLIDNQKVIGNIKVHSKVTTLLKISTYYARKVINSYGKIDENQVVSFPITFVAKKPYTNLKIKIQSLSEEDNFIQNNVVVLKLSFIDKLTTYIKSFDEEKIKRRLKNISPTTSAGKADLIILNTSDIFEIQKYLQKYYGEKHIITFLDNYVLNYLKDFQKIQKYLPIELASGSKNKVFFLIDISGSMNLLSEEDLSIKGVVITNGIIEWLKTLPNINNVEIYLFNDKWFKVPFENIEDLKRKFASIVFSGNTLIVPPLQYISSQATKGDVVWIFSDSIVKDNINRLHAVIKALKEKGIVLYLAIVGRKFGKLKKVFHNNRLEVFLFSRVKVEKIMKTLNRKMDKSSSLIKLAKIFDNKDGKLLYRVENVINTQKKSDTKIVLKADSFPFVAYQLVKGKVNAVVLKKFNYFEEKNLNVEEILNFLLGLVAQKEHFQIYPFYSKGYFNLYMKDDDKCEYLVLTNKNNKLYFFKSAKGIFTLPTMNFLPYSQWKVNACNKIINLSIDKAFLRNSELFFPYQFQNFERATQFPHHYDVKFQNNIEKKSIIWLVLSFVVMLLEAVRRVVRK
jgi:hypothetical protein